MTNDVMIECKNITKIFHQNETNIKDLIMKNFTKNEQDKIVALKDVSFKILKGEMVGVLGLNGSGKTTLLRTISGIYAPNDGSVKVSGTIAPLLQIGIGFKEELNAEDNIILHGMLFGFKKSEIIQKIPEIIKFAELEEFGKLRLKNYSSGMKARLSFSSALHVNPDILLVDEILSVGDVKFKAKSFKAFMTFKEKNKTILFTSHNVELLRKLCDRIILLDHGNLIAFDVPDVITKKYLELTKN